MRRVDATAHAAEDVELPRGVEARGEDLRCVSTVVCGATVGPGAAAAQSGKRVRPGAHVDSGARGRGAGQFRGTGDDLLRACLTDPRRGALQIEVRFERASDEALQLGVAEPIDRKSVV